MNSSNDNPNIQGNTFTCDTEFRITKENGTYFAQKKENDEWVNLKKYNLKTGKYTEAFFFSPTKARRFIKKIQLNAKENGINN